MNDNNWAVLGAYTCPYCGSTSIHKRTDREFRYKCDYPKCKGLFIIPIVTTDDNRCEICKRRYQVMNRRGVIMDSRPEVKKIRKDCKAKRYNVSNQDQESC